MASYLKKQGQVRKRRKEHRRYRDPSERRHWDVGMDVAQIKPKSKHKTNYRKKLYFIPGKMNVLNIQRAPSKHWRKNIMKIQQNDKLRGEGYYQGRLITEREMPSDPGQSKGYSTLLIRRK